MLDNTFLHLEAYPATFIIALQSKFECDIECGSHSYACR